ncbi:hypothetical protein BDR07DRAFT_1385235 [Suillus spraguei]|nr:hypothetical protein BDR07DRAFT_1385235 [Suillus spraguei]
MFAAALWEVSWAMESVIMMVIMIQSHIMMQGHYNVRKNLTLNNKVNNVQHITKLMKESASTNRELNHNTWWTRKGTFVDHTTSDMKQLPRPARSLPNKHIGILNFEALVIFQKKIVTVASATLPHRPVAEAKPKGRHENHEEMSMCAGSPCAFEQVNMGGRDSMFRLAKSVQEGSEEYMRRQEVSCCQWENHGAASMQVRYFDEEIVGVKIVWGGLNLQIIEAGLDRDMLSHPQRSTGVVRNVLQGLRIVEVETDAELGIVGSSAYFAYMMHMGSMDFADLESQKDVCLVSYLLGNCLVEESLG